MGNYTLLQKRSTGYYFRQRIPHELINVAGRKEFTKSLGTKDKKEAVHKLKAVSLEFSQYLEKLSEGGIQPIPSFTPLAGNPVMSQALIQSVVTSEANATEAGRGKTLDWLAEEWIRQKATLERHFKKAGLARRVAKMFQDFHGPVLIGDLESRHLIEFKKHVQNDTTLEIRNKTKTSYFDQIKSMMSLAHDDLLIKHNPFKGLKTTLPETDSVRRLPLEQADLDKLFLNPEYQALRQKDEEYFWIPLIALCTGTRIQEVAQLHCNDVKQKNGIHYFDFNEDAEDKHLKTKVSRRLIPIHNELIRMGFLDYYYSLVNTNHKHLFPNLKPYRGNRAHYIGKWFSSYKISLGIPERKTFHSLRHTFKDISRESDLTKDVHDRLTGHSSSDTSDEYGLGYSITKLNDAVQKLVLPISLARYHINTSQPLNPVPETTQTTALPVKQRQQVSSEELMSAVSLPEAYNRLGKAYCGGEWNDYQMCVLKGSEWVKVDLKEKLAKNYKKQLELHPLELNDLKNLELITASSDDIKRHKQTLTYLEKGITKGLTDCIVRSYRKLKGNANFEVIELDDWNDMKQQSYQFPLSIYESKATASKQWLVLVDSVSLDGYIKRCGW